MSTKNVLSILCAIFYFFAHQCFAQNSPWDSVRYYQKKIDAYKVIDFTREAPIQEILSGQTPEIFPSDQIKETIEFRSRCVDFYNTMVVIQDPSLLTPLSFTKNRMKDRQKKPFVLDADIRVPIALGGKKWYNSRKFFKGVMTTMHIQPQFKVRILRNDLSQGDVSFAVRTPSYMPGVNFFFSNARKWLFEKKSTGYIKLRGFHHSNGQDGPYYDSTGYFNTYNGDFGDNMVFELGYGRVCKTQLAPPKNVMKGSKQVMGRFRMTNWYAGFEEHPLLSESIKAFHFYGRHRIVANGLILHGQRSRNVLREKKTEKKEEMIYATESYFDRENWRLSANMSWIADSGLQYGTNREQSSVKLLDATRRLNLSIAFHARVAGTGHAAGFVEIAYLGSDSYNAYFQQSIAQFRIGISNSFFLYGGNTQRM